MTYVLISLPFIAAGAILWWSKRRYASHQTATTLTVGAVLLVLTAIFDNLMIWVGLVGYGDGQRFGWQVGLVPVEDFFYPVFAVLVVTALWPHPRGER